MRKYLLDANIFIEAKNRYYGFDFCPAFWKWLEKKNAEGTVFSIDKVKKEIDEGNDDLCQWAAEHQDFFLPFSDDNGGLAKALTEISDWAYSPEADYTDSAIRTFLEGADYYLVAYAHVHNYCLVTHEEASNEKKRIKIPNACKRFGIECMKSHEMLRNERVRFVLSQSTASNSES